MRWMTALLVVLAGCGPGYSTAPRFPIPAPRTIPTYSGLPDDLLGKCWAQQVVPAETVSTVRAVPGVAPEVPPGGVVQPETGARVENVERVIRPRVEFWFEQVCEVDLTPEFISSVQRALAARGQFFGVIDGRIGPETETAIRAFQRARGLDSPILSVDAARQMGLVRADIGEGQD